MGSTHYARTAALVASQDLHGLRDIAAALSRCAPVVQLMQYEDEENGVALHVAVFAIETPSPRPDLRLVTQSDT